MQKSILPIVLLPSLALALTACGSNEPKSIIISQPSPQPSAAQAQPSSAAQSQELLQQLEKAQADLKALNEKLEDTKAQSPADQPADNTPNQADAALAQKLEKAQSQIKDLTATVTATKEEAAKQTEEAKKQTEEAKKQLQLTIDGLKKDLQQNKDLAAEKGSELDTKLKELEQKTQELSTKTQELEQTKQQIEELKKQLSAATSGGAGSSSGGASGSAGGNGGGSSPAQPPSPPPAPPSNVVSPLPAVPPKAPEPISIKEALDTLKAIYIPEGSEYQTAVIAIDPSTKSAISDFMTSQYYDTMATENLTLGGVAIELLPNEKVEKTLKGVAMLRQMQASDFENPDNFNASKPSFVGKTYGAGKYIRNDTGEFRYGVYNAKDGKTHLFIHGKQTSYDYPTKNVSYYGSAIMGKNGDYRMLEKSVKADLNIAENTLDITIKPDPSAAEKLSVKADIKAHKSGRNNTHTFNGESATMRVQGGFFGQEDVGGIFEVLSGEHKDENGVFGASANEKAQQAHPADF